MTRRAPLATSLAVALLLAGCSGSDQPAASATTAAASPSPSPSPTLVGNQEFDGAQRLVGGLNESGIECINWERTENPIGALERGSCYIGTQEIVASIYTNADEAEAEPAKKHELLAGLSDVTMVVGPNWTLSCDNEPTCRQVSTQFGGELVVIPA